MANPCSDTHSKFVGKKLCTPESSYLVPPSWWPAFQRYVLPSRVRSLPFTASKSWCFATCKKQTPNNILTRAIPFPNSVKTFRNGMYRMWTNNNNNQIIICFIWLFVRWHLTFIYLWIFVDFRCSAWLCKHSVGHTFAYLLAVSRSFISSSFLFCVRWLYFPISDVYRRRETDT